MMVQDKRYPIEYHIPMPERGEFKRKYPFQQLKVGNSFHVPLEDRTIEEVWSSLTSCCRHASKRTGFSFQMRRDLDGIRVWRVI